MPTIQFARKLVTAKQLSTGSVSHQDRTFGMKSSKSNEARIMVAFSSANVPVCVYHGLGFRPTGAITLSKDAAGTIYTDMPLVADSRSIVLYCDTANTIAEVIVR
jgi:hypothetical protein